MKIKYSLTVLLCTLCLQLTAQEQDHGIVHFFRQVDQLIKKYKKDNVDTTWIGIPERDFMLTLKGRESYQTYDLEFPILLSVDEFPEEVLPFTPSNVADLLFIKSNLHTAKASLQIGFDWHGLAVNLPIPIENSYSTAYSLASNGSRFGFTVRYRVVNNPQGMVENAYDQVRYEALERLLEHYKSAEPGKPIVPDNSPFYPKSLDIESNDWNLKTFYADAYYVFDSEHFSLPAGRTGRLYQKRSAGSVFAMANYMQSRLHMYHALDYTTDDFRHNQFSIGAGYGYNWAFQNGKMCLHASVIPMFSLVNRETHKGYEEPGDPYLYPDMGIELDEDDWAIFERHFYDGVEYGRDSKFTVNGFARLSFNYNCGRSLLNVSCDYRQYLFHSCTDMRITNREFDLTLKYGYRF